MEAIFYANYVIEYSNNNNIEINNLKLQKILYFSNVKKLLESGELLFDESMEKWKYGPVIPSVYHEYKKYGAFPISNKNIVKEIYIFPEKGSLDFSINIKYYDSSELTIDEKNILEATIQNFKNFTPFELVDLTHEHDPWKKSEKEIKEGVQGLKYTTEELLEYFNSNEEVMKWENN